MAALDASAVTVVRQWRQGDLNGKLLRCVQVELALTGQGGTTNLIGAAALGLDEIVEVSNFVTSDNASIYPAAVNAAGTAVLLANLAQATDANRDNPADATSVTLRGVVKGLKF